MKKEDSVDIKSKIEEEYEVLEVSSITTAVRNFKLSPKTYNMTQNVSDLENWSPLTDLVFQSYFDVDGRLLNESKFRESVFNGGCEPSCRPEVWRFLFDMYPMQSTLLERQKLRIALHYKYEALKAIAERNIKNNIKGNDQNNLPSLDLDLINGNLPRPAFSCEERNNYEEEQLLAKLFAAHQDYKQDKASTQKWVNVLDKDIPRTDKENPYFQIEKNIAKLRNILKTYAFFHPEVGYVQGMNDILTRFLVVLDDEVDAYWCFVNHMENVENDFKADSMLEKIKHVECLLDELEPDLYKHLCDCQMHDVIFCHRWLLLSFKREFLLEDSIKYFEIISSNHFGLDTLTAIVARDKQFQEELLKNQGEMNFSKDQIENCASVVKNWYSLEIFVCVAVIALHKEEFLACTDAAEVSHVACHLMGMLNLFKVLEKSKEMLFRYCKKFVHEECQKKKEVSMFGLKNTFSKFVANFSS